MRIIFLSLFILNALILTGQDYQNICSPGYTFYRDSSPLINEYHYDSALVIGQDSVFYSFHTIHRSQYSDCADTHSGPLLCRVVRKKPNGWFVFLDRNTDSIHINSQAGLNESWVCRQMPQNKYIEGKVIAIQQDSVIDTVDQVKEIEFNLKNQDGTISPHMINGTNVMLSKHYGFSVTIDFNKFPFDTVHFTLAGKGCPARGLQGFGWKEVYNFDIDDEFHYSGLEFGTSGGPYFEKMIKVLDKTVYGNMDSVRYIEEVCKIIYYPGIPHYHDTIIQTYNFLYFPNPIILYAPYEFVPDSYNGGYAPEITLKTNNYNGRATKWYWDHAFQYYSNPPCWSVPFEGEHYKYEYSQGLGRSGFYHSVADIVYTYGYEHLVYFKKGSETWGTPLASGCNILLPVEVPTTKAIITVTFIPNPVDNSATVRINGVNDTKRMEISLFDNLGRKILTFPVEDESTVFYRNGFPSGLYLYILKSKEEGYLCSGKLVLK